MKKLLTALTLISIITLFASFRYLPGLAGNFVVIVHNGNPIPTLTSAEAKLYYLRKIKSRWPGINKNIRPADRKAKSPERDAFYSAILKMSDKEVEAYFAERQFQNAERLPEKLSSDAEVIDFVGSEPGSISYVNAKSLTADAKGKVKVVLEF